MASTYKTFAKNDIISTRTLLHEAIPITGTIASGTYGDENIKNFSHGMFQSVYDYPYLSSSANHIFDLTFGYSPHSSLSSSTSVQNSKKINIYNQMAQTLVGYDKTGSIEEFDRDGNILAGGDKVTEAFFINFSRLLTKDEIKKGSFSMTLATGGVWTTPSDELTIYDTNAANDYRVNSPAGDYAILHTSSDSSNLTNGTGVGLIYYQAGIIVLSASVFGKYTNAGVEQDHWTSASAGTYFGNSTNSQYGDFLTVMTASEISSACDGFRNRLKTLSYNNTTELHSTIYFCRINHNDYNYSSNPTYLSASKIRVKNSTTDLPVSYMTTIGLYSADNELLAVAKLSEPLRKDPTNELTLRVRLDY